MAQNCWVHISITLPAGSDEVTLRKVALACLHDEGLDEAVGPSARGLSLERGVDGAPRLVGGSALPVLLRGDPEAVALRLQQALAAAGLGARVVLRDADEGETPGEFPKTAPGSAESRAQTALLHALDCADDGALELARDGLRPELLGPLAHRYFALETWEQRARLILLCCDHQAAALAPIWRDLLLAPIAVPTFGNALHHAFRTAMSGLMALADDVPGAALRVHDFGRDEAAAQRAIERVRALLRGGGAFPIPRALLCGDDPADLDPFTQFTGDARPGLSAADIEELLLTVAESPHDDAPRRALADAIRRRNPARARLIDLGLAIAEHRREGRLPPDALAEEERALLAADGRIWAGPVGKLARHTMFRRGFLEFLWLDAGAIEAFVKPGKGPFSARAGEARYGLHESTPLLDLQVSGAAGQIAALLDRKAFAGLRSLRLAAQGLTDADALALASSTHLTHLRGLDLRANSIGWTGLRALAAAFRDLRWLDISANAVEDPAGADDAPEAGLSDTGRRLLAELGPLPWLESPVRRLGGGAPFPEQLRS